MDEGKSKENSKDHVFNACGHKWPLKILSKEEKKDGTN